MTPSASCTRGTGSVATSAMSSGYRLAAGKCEVLIRSSPHPLDELAFLGAHGIRVYRGGRELRVAEQLLQRVERHTGRDRFDAEAVTQPFGRGMWTGDLRSLHHGPTTYKP